jgi:hypothetical protein
VICPACGRESPDGFLFCGFCGTTLAEAALSEARELFASLGYGPATAQTEVGEKRA